MVSSHLHSPGDELMSRLMAGDMDGEVENRLLHELQNGYPVIKVRRLLQSDDETVVAAGMWIASELGGQARPLFAEIVDRIHHPSFRVRFFSLDCLATCARPEDTRALMLGLDLLDDPEPGVRWKALMFLTGLSEPQLRAASAAATEQDVAPHRRGLELLLHVCSSRDTASVSSALASDNPMLRRYAAAAAARLAHQDPRVLREAMGCADPVIKQFAADIASRIALK